MMCLCINKTRNLKKSYWDRQLLRSLWRPSVRVRRDLSEFRDFWLESIFDVLDKTFSVVILGLLFSFRTLLRICPKRTKVSEKRKT